MMQIDKEKMKYWWTAFYCPIYFIFFEIVEKLNKDVTIVSIGFDHKIPFIEAFIIPYYMWFPYIVITWLFFFLKDKKEFLKYMTYLYIGMTLFIIISFVFPNGIDIRPDHFERDNIFVKMVKAIYASDTSTNVLPSIHVYNSVVVAVAAWKSRKVFTKKWSKWTCTILTFLIILSTVFTKQHSVVDVIFGIILAWIVYYVVYSEKGLFGD